MTNSSSWSYTDNDFGPRTWLERYKVAKGNLQSPINIDKAQVVVGDNVGPIQFQYVNIQNSTITNDGRHLQVTVIKNESAVNGGPLSDKYQLAIIRFHWGNESVTGSEHAINGQKYPFEVQLIHWNKDRYKNIGEAMVGENGLCIIGLLYQVSDEDNEGLKPIIELISRDENKGCFSLEVKSTINPNEFIRDMTSYWSYQGSLTTPPLTENVTWVISESIMSLSAKQIKAFRTIKNTSGVLMGDHYRPLCPQNERLVRLCTCVVKSPSADNQSSALTNHTMDDVVYSDRNSVHQYNGFHDATEDTTNEEGFRSHEEDLQNDEEDTDTKDDEEKSLQSQDTNSDNKEEACGFAKMAFNVQDSDLYNFNEECNDDGETLDEQVSTFQRNSAIYVDEGEALHDQETACLQNYEDYGEKALRQEATNLYDTEREDFTAKVDDDKSLKDQDDNGEECMNPETTDSKYSGENEEFKDTDANLLNEETGIQSRSEECDDVEKVLHDQNADRLEHEEECETCEDNLHYQAANCPSNDVKCNEEGKDLQEVLQEDRNFSANTEECSEAGISFGQETTSHMKYEVYSYVEGLEGTSHGHPDGCDAPEKVSQDLGTSSDGIDKECHNTESNLQNEDTSCHGNGSECDDKENDPTAENTTEESVERGMDVLDEDTRFYGDQQDCNHTTEAVNDQDEEHMILLNQDKSFVVSVDECDDANKNNNNNLEKPACDDTLNLAGVEIFIDNSETEDNETVN